MISPLRKIMSALCDLKLGAKIFIGIGICAVVICIQGYQFQHRLAGVNRHSSVIVTELQPALLYASSLSEKLNQGAMALGYYLMSRDEGYLKTYRDDVRTSLSILENLRGSRALVADPERRRQLEDVASNLARFAAYESEVAGMARDSGKTSQQYATDSMNPLVREISELMSQLVFDEAAEQSAGPERKQLLADFGGLRHAWTSLNNELRLFLAFQASEARENMVLYREALDAAFERVAAQQRLLTFEEQHTLEQIREKLPVYRDYLAELVTIHADERWRVGAVMIRTELAPLLQLLTHEISALVQDLEHLIEHSAASVSQAHFTGQRAILHSTLVTLLVMIAVGWILARNLSGSLMRAVRAADAIAGGNLSGRIGTGRRDEAGMLLQSLDTMQTRLRESLENERTTAAASNRIRQALDNATNNILLVDENYDIIYVNNAMREFARTAEQDFRSSIRDFRADRLLGASIDAFHRNPAHVRKLLSSVNDAVTAEFRVGGRHIRVIATPVFDDQGRRIGAMAELLDQTQENAIRQEIGDIVACAMSGDLSRRIRMEDKEGFFATLSDGINNLVRISENVINATVAVLGAMARGDLTRSIQGDYQGTFGQLKDNANATIVKLTEVLGKIRISADTVKSGSQEIARGNNNLLSRSQEQTASLRETAASMETMTTTVRQNAHNAQCANELAASARDQAEQGGDVVGNAVTAMGEITTASRKIADIIGVIDEIAFQTNLLALNAAVEAARAGDQGRGFAVVASEVRNLAGRSATAAQEIKALIEDSVAKVDEGSQLVNASGKTLGEIVVAVKKVSDIIAEIAAASAEQSIGIEQVNRAVTQMDQMTQQSAALVEEAANASGVMGEEAEGLHQLVSFFVTDDSAGGKDVAERRSGTRPWAQSGNRLSALDEKMDFSAARLKHLNWKSQLRSFLDGKKSMTVAEAVSERDCDLGKWLYSSGLGHYGHLPEMSALEAEHCALHATVKNAIRLKQAGKLAAAEQEYTRLEQLSGRIVDLLHRVEDHVEGESNQPKSTGAHTDSGGNGEMWAEF
ncbi:MAG: methyl-accepting chemotaxis protein [Pseudomonadota bacterium]